MATNCERFQDAASARVDGELLGMPEEALDAHLQHCASCQAFSVRAQQLHRMARIGPIEVVPDQTAVILSALSEEPTPAVRGWRAALVAIGFVQLLSALPNLFPAANGDAAHASRHLAAFGIALAASFFFVAWRPQRAAAVAPVLGLLAALLVGLSAIDVVAGRVPAGDEVRHAIALIGAVVVWMIGRSATHTPNHRVRPLPSSA